MLKHILTALALLVISGTTSGQELKNQMLDHPAPYLALHGKDPVAWQVWGDDAVALAREQNKILYLSIGYFSCHWCHVMQKETFQDNEVADYLNRNFISVKVDRELEPALDFGGVDTLVGGSVLILRMNVRSSNRMIEIRRCLVVVESGDSFLDFFDHIINASLADQLKEDSVTIPAG